jgi:hypothetical protein
MDMKALRAPTHTALEFAAARAGTQSRVPRVAPSAAPRVLEPVIRTEAWRRLYEGAVRDKLPEPERFADAAVRSREIALLKKQTRSKTLVLTEAPKAHTSAVEASSKSKCQAKTLEGRQCGFSATCGCFCKKHAPKEPMRPSFQLTTDSRRFTTVRLKGYVNAKPALVTKILGKPNGSADAKIEMEWMLVFADGTPATLFYSRDDPSLHVCGEGVEVISRIRQLLAL